LLVSMRMTSARSRATSGIDEAGSAPSSGKTVEMARKYGRRKLQSKRLANKPEPL
jgi:hypothetical protein